MTKPFQSATIKKNIINPAHIPTPTSSLSVLLAFLLVPPDVAPSLLRAAACLLPLAHGVRFLSVVSIAIPFL